MNSNFQSQNAIPVSCDKCQNVFSISGFESETLNADHHAIVERTYFTCPSCGHKYTCYYTDEHIRIKQKDIQRLYKLQATKPTTARAKRLVSLQQQLRQTMTTLRQVVQDD